MDDFERALREARDQTPCPRGLLHMPDYPGCGYCFRCNCARETLSAAIDGEGSDTDAMRLVYDAGVRDGERETMTPAELARRMQTDERWAVGDD